MLQEGEVSSQGLGLQPRRLSFVTIFVEQNRPGYQIHSCQRFGDVAHFLDDRIISQKIFFFKAGMTGPKNNNNILKELMQNPKLGFRMSTSLVCDIGNQ